MNDGGNALSDRYETLKLICIAVGLIGLGDAVILGINLIKYFLILAQVFPELITEVVIAAVGTVTSSVMLSIGAYLVYRGQGNRGGVLNIIAGGITIALYAYYANFWEVIFLTDLGAFGYIMLFPALASGLLGLLLFEEKRQANPH